MIVQDELSTNKMKLSLDKDQPAYVAGEYTLHSSSFTVNNFGSLELKRFGMIIELLEAKTVDIGLKRSMS